MKEVLDNAIERIVYLEEKNKQQKENTQTITRTYTDKTVVFERKRKAINQDTKKQIRISNELLEKVEDKLSKEKDTKGFSNLVRTLLEEYVKGK